MPGLCVVQPDAVDEHEILAERGAADREVGLHALGTARARIDAGHEAQRVDDRRDADGVQILANYLYLIAQFLNRETNRRTDDYGGTLENRARFLFETVEAVLDRVDPSRVGVKISPMHEGGPFAANDETLPMAEYAVRELNGYGLSHLLLMGNTTDFTGTPLEHLADDGMFRHFRPIFTGTLIANVAMTAERGNRLIDEGLADMVAFGRPFIANPDLVARIAKNAPLAEIDWATVYAAGPEGYVDYPAWRPGQPA